MATPSRLPRFTAVSQRVHLFNLSPAPNSQKNQKRVGRGDGSGRGGTSGRGNKGQNARTGGGVRVGFEGGQTSILKRFPKRGFTNPSEKNWAPVNLNRIQEWINQGRLTSSPDSPITARELLLSGCINNVHDGVKVLGNGAEELKTAIHIVPSRASKSAIEAIEKNGGTVFCKYYTPLSLRDCVKGNASRIAPAPTKRQDINWYTNWKNRGYLSQPALARNPLAEERWKALAVQLSPSRQKLQL